MVKNRPANVGNSDLIPGLERSQWQPTAVFLPRKSYGRRSLEGYSPWYCKRVGHDLATKQQQQTYLKKNIK